MNTCFSTSTLTIDTKHLAPVTPHRSLPTLQQMLITYIEQIAAKTYPISPLKQLLANYRTIARKVNLSLLNQLSPNALNRLDPPSRSTLTLEICELWADIGNLADDVHLLNLNTPLTKAKKQSLNLQKLSKLSLTLFPQKLKKMRAEFFARIKLLSKLNRKLAQKIERLNRLFAATAEKQKATEAKVDDELHSRFYTLKNSHEELLHQVKRLIRKSYFLRLHRSLVAFFN